jgi:hypothetical protein
VSKLVTETRRRTFEYSKVKRWQTPERPVLSLRLRARDTKPFRRSVTL